MGAVTAVSHNHLLPFPSTQPIGDPGLLPAGARAQRRAHRVALSQAALVAPPLGPDHGPLRAGYVCTCVLACVWAGDEGRLTYPHSNTHTRIATGAFPSLVCGAIPSPRSPCQLPLDLAHGPRCAIYGGVWLCAVKGSTTNLLSTSLLLTYHNTTYHNTTTYMCPVRDRFYQRRATAIEGRLRALTGMIEGVRGRMELVQCGVVGRLLDATN